MINKKGFAIVEILVIVVILAVVGLIIMMSVIPQIEQNAKESFLTDSKLYIQAATKHFSDIKIDEENFTGGCVSISDLNKTDVGVVDKKNYSGYISLALDEDNNIIYNISITNKRFYSYNRLNNNYLVDSEEFEEGNILDNYDTVKDFPTKCPN